MSGLAGCFWWRALRPGAYILVRLGNSHNQKPLSVPISLKKGGFTSPYFTVDSGEGYLVDVNWDLVPARQTLVDLDWKIVADSGSVIQQGAFNNPLRGANSLRLGEYKPASSQREQIVLNVHSDVDQGGAHATLEIGPPETLWRVSEQIPLAAKWAAFVAFPGAILLLIPLAMGAKQRKLSGIAP